ncbi:sulfite exporter TauE/SafE family protein [Dyella choica]|uniref:Probable membrane transporter protein n=1 Tax=Dyella choica TaxID=1927959 RepID=A0A3S0SCH2_9GAMM|nr:sulfite exporter TauE/SafE family protein [Dyella choica]RUL79721.1 sulfite exporter TauE/SafE family protein [Dyella choica]
MAPLSEFLIFTGIGALAQLVDGALGMAYGVTSAGMLLGIGMPPALASASVHYAETFTCGASGLSHWWAGNVQRRLFLVLVIPGVIGAVLGATALAHMPPTWIRYFLTPYLLAMGLFLVFRTSRRRDRRQDVPRGTSVLGFVAGVLDAAGGGGWSALTVTTMVARGQEPRMVIGSVHLAKCIVSLAASITFLLSIGQSKLHVVLGLILGGVIAAPFGAWLVRRLPSRVSTLMAGLTVLALGIYNFHRLLR